MIILVLSHTFLQLQPAVLHPYLPHPNAWNGSLLLPDGSSPVEGKQVHSTAGHDSSSSNGQEQNRQEKGKIFIVQD